MMKPKYYILIIVVVSGIFISTQIKDGHNWNGDFSLYLNQAKHIAEGFSLDELYQWNKFAMQNSEGVFGPYLYPNGFPLLLSAIYYFLGIDFIWMKIFCSLFFLLSIPLIFSLFKDYFKTSAYPIILICLVAFNLKFISFSDNILSDFPFFFFCFLTFYCMNFKNNVWNQLLLGVCMFYTYFIRDIGIVLVPTLFTYQLINSNKYLNSRFIKFIPYLVFIGLFTFTKSIFPNGGENHLDVLFAKLSLKLILENTWHYTLKLSNIFFHFSFFFIGLLILTLLMGAYAGAKKYLHFIIFILLYLFVLIIWPERQGVRFIFPIIPFLLFFILRGIIFIRKKYNLRMIYLRLVLGTYFALFFIMYFIKVDFSKDASNKAYTSEMIDIYDYISRLQPLEQVIIGFKKPRVLALFSGVMSINVSLDNFENSIASYMLIEKNTAKGYNKKNIQKEFPSYVLLKK